MFFNIGSLYVMPYPLPSRSFLYAKPVVWRKVCHGLWIGFLHEILRLFLKSSLACYTMEQSIPNCFCTAMAKTDDFILVSLCKLNIFRAAKPLFLSGVLFRYCSAMERFAIFGGNENDRSARAPVAVCSAAAYVRQPQLL